MEKPRAEPEGSAESGAPPEGTERTPASEGPEQTPFDSTSTIEDLLRLIDELQRKSSNHDDKLRELQALLLRAPPRKHE